MSSNTQKDKFFTIFDVCFRACLVFGNRRIFEWIFLPAKSEICGNTLCISKISGKAGGKICQKDDYWRMLNRLLTYVIDAPIKSCIIYAKNKL